MKVGIILGTIRKSRKSSSVGALVLDVAKKRMDTEVDYEIVDLRDFDLPLFAEALPPASTKQRETRQGRDWALKLESFDIFIFINAEYNRGIPGCLKNAIDYVGTEFKDKVGAIVSYGVSGGNSSANNLRISISRLGLYVVRNQPFFTLSDFDDENNLLQKSSESAVKSINWMLTSAIKLSKKLR